jgi:hypothetical protein
VHQVKPLELVLALVVELVVELALVLELELEPDGRRYELYQFCWH